MPTVHCMGRWYSAFLTLRRVVPEARLRRDAQTSGSLGVVPEARLRRDAGLPARRVRGVGPSQNLGPLE
jgi:hypothetical protein